MDKQQHDQSSCTTAAINLNNMGALQLEQHGDAAAALNSFSEAARYLVMMGPPTTTDHQHHHHHHYWSQAAAASSSSHWHWLDCSRKVQESIHQQQLQQQLNDYHHQQQGMHLTSGNKDASVSFVFMRTMAISHSSSHTSVSSLSIPILFNLALCCTILGIQLGEQQGQGFLMTAHDMYQRVQGLVDEMEYYYHHHCSCDTTTCSSSSSTTTTTRPMSMMIENKKMSLLLSMAIANNCACIHFTNHKVIPQATMFDCLNRLASMLEWSSSPAVALLRAQDRGDFVLNLHILTASQSIAPAA